MTKTRKETICPACGYSGNTTRVCQGCGREQTIRVLVVPIGEPAYDGWVDNELGQLQAIVDGYIEVIYIARGIVLVCNEEGKLLGLPVGIVCNGDPIAGTFFFARVEDDGEFHSLTDEDVASLMRIVHQRLG